MAALKIVFISGEKQTVLYAQGMKHMWQVESHVLERLGQVERQALADATFRKYWIDEENDHVDIINDADFEFFLRRSSTQKTPKIFFEAIIKDKKPAQKDNELNPDKLNVHLGVACDGCEVAPIRGHRYKCLQCSNFDLCMKCESEMKHPEHLMARIPSADSPKLETYIPIVFGETSRRQQKYAARAAKAAGASTAEAAPKDCGKSRHHRYHRKHCTSGIFTNFYDMMQDLAEGGVNQESSETPPRKGSVPPQVEQPFEVILAQAAAAQAAKEAADAAAAAAAAARAVAAQAAAAQAPTSADNSATNNMSKETNTSPERSSAPIAGAQSTTPNASIPVTPSLENLIDPQFMKAGIQILNNFSEMFGKILDPVVTDTTSRASSAPESVVNIDLTQEKGASATPPPTAAETPNKPAAGSNQTSNVASGIVTPMETETSAPLQAASLETSQQRERSHSEENDWTMIDSNASTNFEAPPAAAAAAAPTTAAAAPIDFAKLSQQLQSHIENEMKSVSSGISLPAASVSPPEVVAAPIVANVAPIPAPTATSAPTPASAPAPAPESVERRAVAVFHADPRINSAIHGMMAMGFSNEGAVLTQLLESVNGSIPLALDLMSAAQRN